jgi:coproporphyrinogen III oxidase-like Fe-S oxidoreductase
LTAHPETIDYLFGNGLRGATFGIETFNDEAAKFVGKGGNRKRQIETLRTIKQRWGSSVGLHGTFIFGLPYETPESLQNTIDWLLGDDCPLDSWATFALNIRPSTSSTFASNGFVSQIDRDWKKLGYTENDKPDANYDIYDISRHKQNLVWRNEHFDYVSLKKLTNKLWQQSQLSKKLTTSIQNAFQLAGLGQGLDPYINHYTGDLDWYKIDQLKMQRIYEYKNKVWAGLGIPNSPDFSQQATEYVTYSNYLRARQTKSSTLVLQNPTEQ